MQLDRMAEEYCRDHGGIPAFKGYYDFPCSLCVSINEEVVHGIPSRKRILRAGDIVSLDFGAVFQGFMVMPPLPFPLGTRARVKMRSCA